MLSQFAGAADEMKGALMVNPHDMVGMSEAIGVALSMPLAERKQRYETNMVALRKYNLGVWRDSFLADLKGVKRAAEG